MYGKSANGNVKVSFLNATYLLHGTILSFTRILCRKMYIFVKIFTPTNMKTEKKVSLKHLLRMGFAAVCMMSMTSCETTDDNGDGDGDGNSSNYWESNALRRMQLRGNVKTLVEGNWTVQFNDKGNMTSEIEDSEWGVTEDTYTYDSNGRPTSQTSINGYSQDFGPRFLRRNLKTADTQQPALRQAAAQTVTTTYTYGTHGKYVPIFAFHLLETGLYPNLTAITRTDGTSVEYKFEGDSLLMINTYVYTYEDGTESEKDTTVFHYEGKYPTRSQTEWSFMKDLTYFADGRFATYTEGHQGSGIYSPRVYSMMENSPYILTETIVQSNYFDNKLNNTYTTTFTYNEHGDVVSMVEDEYQEEYTYTYDDQNNWIVRTNRYKNGPAWMEGNTIERTITYY